MPISYIRQNSKYTRKKLKVTESYKEKFLQRPIRMIAGISMEILKATRACLKRHIIDSERLKLLIQTNIPCKTISHN